MVTEKQLFGRIFAIFDRIKQYLHPSMKTVLLLILFILTAFTSNAQQSDRLRLKLSGKVKTVVIYQYQSGYIDTVTHQPKDTNSTDGKMFEYFNPSGGLDSTVTYGKYPGGKEIVFYRALFLNDSMNRLKLAVRHHPQSIFKNDMSKAAYIWRDESYTIQSFSKDTDELKDSVIYHLDHQKRDSLIHFVSLGDYKNEYTMNFVYYGKDAAFSYKNTYTNLLKGTKYISLVKNKSYDESGNPTHICYFGEDGKTIQRIYKVRYYYYD